MLKCDYELKILFIKLWYFQRTYNKHCMYDMTESVNLNSKKTVALCM